MNRKDFIVLKLNNKRYNPREFRSYYPHTMPVGNPAIVIEWRETGRPDEIIPFETEEERDLHLKAWDEVLLMVDEGQVVVDYQEVPMIFGGGGMGSPGGIDLH